jgi:nicotinamidase/pyrazinamidase
MSGHDKSRGQSKSSPKKEKTYTASYFTGEKSVLFWNVDTQYDFMRSDDSFAGALAVAGARVIEGNLERLTKFAEKEKIKVVNTADWHTIDDDEISSKPDFKNTYPPHCMQETKGASYVPATSPENPYIVSWQDKKIDASKVSSSRNIVLYKNNFDVFPGNKYADQVVDMLTTRRDAVFIYGVATNVCVNFAVEGLLKRGRDVYVVKDAIKELPDAIAATSLDSVLKTWENHGAKLVTTHDVEKMTRRW